MSDIIQSSRQSYLSYKSGVTEPQPPESYTLGLEEQNLAYERSETDTESSAPIPNSGECRLIRAINESFGYHSHRCSTGCLYSMDDLIPSGYLLLIDEQNNSWFCMQLTASSQSVTLWFADFSARLQESLDEEARGRLFMPGRCQVFVGAKGQTAGAPLHCRRFAYLPNEVLNHPSLMLHHLPISPDQLLLIDHAYQAAAYVPVVVGFATQPDKHYSSVSSQSS